MDGAGFVGKESARDRIWATAPRAEGDEGTE
jgi:hypothetical protein